MWRAVVLGAVTGLRSQLPMALLVWRQWRGDLPGEVAGPARIYQRRGAVMFSVLAALGELFADKLSTTPSRLDEGPFYGRLALGATAGAGVASAFGRSRLLGGALGTSGAAAGSVLGHRFRALAGERTNVPDVVWALVEDTAAITLGLAATRAPAGTIDGSGADTG